MAPPSRPHLDGGGKCCPVSSWRLEPGPVRLLVAGLCHFCMLRREGPPELHAVERGHAGECLCGPVDSDEGILSGSRPSILRRGRRVEYLAAPEPSASARRRGAGIAFSSPRSGGPLKWSMKRSLLRTPATSPANECPRGSKLTPRLLSGCWRDRVHRPGLLVVAARLLEDTLSPTARVCLARNELAQE